MRHATHLDDGRNQLMLMPASLRPSRTATYLELVHELLRGGREHDDAAGAGVDEPFLHRLVDEGQQRVVVAVHVQQPDLIEQAEAETKFSRGSEHGAVVGACSS